MNKKNLFFVVFILNTQVFNSSYAVGGEAAEILAAAMDRNTGKLGEIAPTLGENGATKIANAITTAAVVAGGAAVGYGAGYVVYYTYKEVKAGVNATASGLKTTARWIFPGTFTSTEEQLHEKEVSNRLRLLEKKEALYKSLVKNVSQEKNKMGIPKVSEKAANEYAVVAGITALAEVVEEFKGAYYSKECVA